MSLAKVSHEAASSPINRAIVFLTHTFNRVHWRASMSTRLISVAAAGKLIVDNLLLLLLLCRRPTRQPVTTWAIRRGHITQPARSKHPLQSNLSVRHSVSLSLPMCVPASLLVFPFEPSRCSDSLVCTSGDSSRPSPVSGFVPNLQHQLRENN